MQGLFVFSAMILASATSQDPPASDRQSSAAMAPSLTHFGSLRCPNHREIEDTLHNDRVRELLGNGLLQFEPRELASTGEWELRVSILDTVKARVNSTVLRDSDCRELYSAALMWAAIRLGSAEDEVFELKIIETEQEKSPSGGQAVVPASIVKEDPPTDRRTAAKPPITNAKLGKIDQFVLVARGSSFANLGTNLNTRIAGAFELAFDLRWSDRMMLEITAGYGIAGDCVRVNGNTRGAENCWSSNQSNKRTIPHQTLSIGLHICPHRQFGRLGLITCLGVETGYAWLKVRNELEEPQRHIEHRDYRFWLNTAALRVGLARWDNDLRYAFAWSLGLKVRPMALAVTRSTTSKTGGPAEFQGGASMEFSFALGSSARRKNPPAAVSSGRLTQRVEVDTP